MKTFVVEGSIIVSVEIEMEAESILKVWEELDSRLCPLLCLSGYTLKSDISSSIIDSDLAIREATST